MRLSVSVGRVCNCLSVWVRYIRLHLHVDMVDVASVCGRFDCVCGVIACAL